MDIVDLTVQSSEFNDFENHRMTVGEQLATLKAIQDYNAALPKAKRKKDSLPEIATHGITSREILRRSGKAREIGKVSTYHAMGIAEGHIDHTSITDDIYSLSAKKHALQRASSQQKIANIR